MQKAKPEPTGSEVWQHLMEGNERFVTGRSHAWDLPALRRSLVAGQEPVAAMLCCSDSRVPPEVIFDQSLGDLFVVRTAGLVLEPTSIGSLEYAVDHLKVPLLIIMGHESCGAVTAAVQHPEADEGHIGAVIAQISPSVAQARKGGKIGADLVEVASDLHSVYLAETLVRDSAIIREAVEAGKLKLVVAKYFFHNGQVKAQSTNF